MTDRFTSTDLLTAADAVNFRAPKKNILYKVAQNRIARSVTMAVAFAGGAMGFSNVGSASADFDACVTINGVPDSFPQPSVPLPLEDPDGDHNCTTRATVQPTGTARAGSEPSQIATPHNVATLTSTATPTVFDACPRVNGVIDTFPQPTIPLALEDPDHDGNCTTRLTPPPTGTPNGNDRTPLPDFCLDLDGIQNPIPYPYVEGPNHTCVLSTPTSTATATPTRTSEKTPTQTTTPKATVKPTKVASTPVPPSAGTGTHGAGSGSEIGLFGALVATAVAGAGAAIAAARRRGNR